MTRHPEHSLTSLRQKGWMPKLFAASISRGCFSLDILFYRTKGAAPDRESERAEPEPRWPQIDLWLPHAPATLPLVALQKSNRVGASPFPLRKPFQSGPRRQG